MDPITAWALATKAVAELLSKIVEGQTLEQRQKIGDWFIADQERLRKFLKLDV